MKRRTFTVARLLLVLALAVGPALVAGCGDDTSNNTNYTAINVVPGNATIGIGATATFVALGVTSTGSTDISKQVTWESSDATVATVSGGTATAFKAGTTSIRAKLGNLVGSASLTVKERKLIAVTVTPPAATIAAGTSQSFTATGNYDDGTNGDVSDTATWTSSDATIATVAKGKADGLKAGTTTIKAELSGVSGSALLTVSASVKSLEVTPADASISVGGSQQYTATAILLDNSKQNVTGQVTWASDTTTVATIDATGLAKGVAKGKAKITASLGTGATAKTASVTLTVSDKLLTKVEVAPAADTVAVGGKKSFKATAIYNDNSSSDVTATATWASSDPTKADKTTVAGEFLGKAAGQVNITATYGTPAVVGTAILLVTSTTVITSIAVTPNPGSVAKGTTLAFKAVATYSDNTTANVTSSAAWQSSQATVATVDTTTNPGLATGVAKGTVDITATQAGVSGKATLNVTDATCQSITITPSNTQTIGQGAAITFTAACNLSDKTTLDVTSQVTWIATPAAILSFTSNVAKGIAQGTTTVTCSLPAFPSAASNSVVVNVTPKSLTGLAIDNAPTAPIPVGASYGFTCTGTWSDGSKTDETANVVWSSSDATVASISNAAGSNGTATALQGGTTQIQAKLGSLSSTAVKLDVQVGVSLSYIAVTPDDSTVNVGQSVQLKAVGHYSDGSNYDITPTVTWLAVCHTGTSAVNNVTVDKGKVVGVSSTNALACGSATLGYARVMAKLGAIQSFAKVTVKDTTISSVGVTCTPPLTCLPTNLGFKVVCKATATFADSTNGDVTATASWTSTDTAVATAAAGGSVTLVGAGTAVVVATAGGKASPSTGVPNATVQGAALTLTAISVSPASPKVNKGGTLSFTATGTFSGACCPAGGCNYAITEQASWTSANTTVASVSNAAGQKGQAVGLAAGNSSIAAAYGTVSGAAALTVDQACLQKVTIDQHDPTYPGKVVAPLTVKGYFSDAPTTPVQLKPADYPNAFSGFSGCPGYAVDQANWMLVVGAASCPGITFSASAGTCGGAPKTDVTDVSVSTTASLTALAVKPTDATMAAGNAQDFVATATFGNLGSFNVTPWAAWSNNPAVAGLTHGDAAAPAAELPAERFTHQGTVLGVTTVSVTYGTSTATAKLTITPGVIKTVTISNVSPSPCNGGYPVGIRLGFTAVVEYTDGTKVTNPGGITFTSSAPAKLDIPASSLVGTTLAPSAGANPTVTATYNSVPSAPFPILIHPNSGAGAVTLTDMTFSEPQGSILDQNITKLLTVTGVYGTCGTFDISALVTSASGNSSLVDVQTGTTGTVIKTFATPTSGTPVTLSFIKDGLTRTLGINVGTSQCFSSVSIAPASATVPNGTTQDYTATATDTKGGQTDVTTLGSWVSSAPTTYQSTGIVAGKARFRGIAVGNATVTFTLVGGGSVKVCKGGDTSLTTINASANAAVSAATVATVTIWNDLGGTSDRWVPLGETVQYTAIATLTDGTTQDVTSAPGTIWTAAPAGIVTISNAGLVATSGIGSGLIGVTTANGKTDSIGVNVQDCGNPTLTVTSASSGKLPLGQFRDYNATAVYPRAGACALFFSTEVTFDVTAQAKWLSSNPAAATVNNTGRVTSVAVGSTNLTASYKGQTSPTVAVDVVAVTLKSLTISQPSASLPLGSNQDITVSAVWTDGASNFTLDPPVVTWQVTNNPLISIVGPKAGSGNKKYTLTALQANGSTTYFAQVSTVISNTLNLATSSACITGITINQPGADVVLPPGVPFELEFVCSTSDGSSLPCNPAFTVTGDTNGIIVDYTATYAKSGKARVKENAAAGQTASVAATVAGCAAANKTSTRKITVGAAILSSISIPTSVSLQKGTQKDVPTTAVYTGATGSGAGTYDVTDIAVYTSSNPAVASTLAPNPGGTISAQQLDGSAFLTSAFKGKTSNQSTIVVSGKLLTDITITAEPNLVGGPAASAQYPAGGFALQLSASGKYSDNSVDPNLVVSWSLDTPVVTGTGISATGLLTTGTPAATTVQVVRAKLAPAGDATFSVTIVPGAVTTIAIRNANGTPLTTFTVAKGLEVGYAAYVTILGGTTYWATRNVTWASSVPAVGTVVSSGTDAGKFKGVTPGVTNISASKGSVSSGPVAITVTSATPVSVYCKPATVALVPGATAQLRAWVRLSDATENEITDDTATNWTSSAATKADFNVGVNDPKGLVTGVAVGSAFGVPVYNSIAAAGADRCAITVQ